MGWRGRFVSFAKVDATDHCTNESVPRALASVAATSRSLQETRAVLVREENIMKRTLIRLLTISCLLAAGSLNSVAQEKKPRPDKAEIQADVIFKVIAPKIAIGKV